MHEILFIGGFAQSGKSTTLKLLKENYDCEVFSSSVLLHKILQDIFSVLGLDDINTHKKEDILFFDCLLLDPSISTIVPHVLASSKSGRTIRDVLIGVAEKVLVKHFTRRIFAEGVALKLRNFLGFNSQFKGIIVIETIGGVEYQYLLSMLNGEAMRYHNVNVESKYSNPEADGRKLLPNATTLYNDGTKNLSFALEKTMLSLGLDKYSKYKDQDVE